MKISSFASGLIIILFLHLSAMATAGEEQETATDPQKEKSLLDQAQEAKDKYWAQLKSKVKESKKALEGSYLTTDLSEFLKAVESKELPKIQNLATKLDRALESNILGYYYKAFEIEETESPEKAKAYLQTLHDDNKLGPYEKKAIEGLHGYFSAKGSISTKEAAIIILVIAIESKFPHGRGTIFLAPLLKKKTASYSKVQETNQDKAETKTTGKQKDAHSEPKEEENNRHP